MDFITQGITIFHKGGFVMYILLLCSLFVLSICIERFLYFRQLDSGRQFAAVFYRLMNNDKFAEAQQLTATSHGSLALILHSAMIKSPMAANNIKAFFEIQSGIILAKFRRRLYYLNVIVTMAPLLGLLGTISGMISAFSVFNIQEGQAHAITGGVGEALIATATGLCVAIVALAIHAYFMQRIDNIVTDMEQSFSLVEAHHNRGDSNASA